MAALVGMAAVAVLDCFLAVTPGLGPQGARETWVEQAGQGARAQQMQAAFCL